MKVHLCFHRDADGQPRLFHAFDEHELQEGLGQVELGGWAPPSLDLALSETVDGPGRERWAMVVVDTDQPIAQGVGESIPVDFDRLMPR